MVLRGEQTFPVTSGKALKVLEEQAGAVAGNNLDAARDFLVQCGRFEQGSLDALASRTPAASTRSLTNAAAQAFLAIFSGRSGERLRQPIAEALMGIAKTPEFDLYLAVPQSFTLEAVFPEQYILSTKRFLAENPALRKAEFLVLGNRNGGTALTALVCAVLEEQGIMNGRGTVTLSPAPDPRPVLLDLPSVPGAFALVVDSGPGFSGADAAALGDVACTEGIPRENVYFLPAEPVPPGALTTERTREWWTGTRQFAVGSHEIRWSGKSLSDRLGAEAEQWLGAPCVSVHDFGRGAWRSMVWVEPRLWPAVMPHETPKFLCRTAAGQGVLWKFHGFGSGSAFERTLIEEQWDRMQELAARSWAPQPLGRQSGFIASPWVQGQRLTSRDIDYPLLNQLANYILTAALPPVQVKEAKARFQELQNFVLQTVRGSFSPAMADRIADFIGQTECPVQFPSHGDGRLAPHKWVRTESGNILKLDGAGHRLDHTGLGAQSILWDLAGLIVEWNLPGSAQVQLQQQFANADIPVTRQHLHFYLLAYLAWKLARHDLSLRTLTGDLNEIERHRHAREEGRARLEQLASGLQKRS